MKVYTQTIPSWRIGDRAPSHDGEYVTLYGWAGADEIVVGTNADPLSWHDYCEGLREELADAEWKVEAIQDELDCAEEAYETAFDSWDGWREWEVDAEESADPWEILRETKQTRAEA